MMRTPIEMAQTACQRARNHTHTVSKHVLASFNWTDGATEASLMQRLREVQTTLDKITFELAELHAKGPHR